MASLKVYNAEGEFVEEIEVQLDETLAHRGEDVLALSLIRQASNARSNYAHAKTRSEVRGGGAKPWRQKGTGRARVGSRRSPIWVGGGKAFGPSKNRNFKKDMNKQARRLAVKKALYHAIVDEKFALLATLDFTEPSTKRGVKLLNGVGFKGKILFIHNYSEIAILRSFSNIPKLDMYNSERINARDLLFYDGILCDRGEFELIRERWLS